MNIEELIQQRIDIHLESQSDTSMSDDYVFIKEMIIKELMHIQKVIKLNKEFEQELKEN